VVDVDTTRPGRVWRGVGAALTDSSRRLLWGDGAATRALFGPGGARLDLVRLPLSGTDFSPGAWTWGWDGRTATPTRQASASARFLTGQVVPLQPRLAVMGTPWTAPGAMKTSGTARGGVLRAAALPSYARMIASQVRWLQGHGVPVRHLTVGNEPGYSADYASMTMSDVQLAALGIRVRQALAGRGVQLWAVDHNWADRGRVDAVLAAAPGVHTGAAFHCYAGSPDQLAGLEVPSILTECTGTGDGWQSTFWWDAVNLVVKPVQHGSTGLLFWNLALDPDHGPVDPGSRAGCRTCRGLLTVRPDGTFQREPEWFTASHLTRAARAGARVLPVSAPWGVHVAAFRDPDGSVGVFGLDGRGTDLVVGTRVDGRPGPSYVVRAGELFTLRLPG
jgi:glucosylceramidase